MLIKFTRLLLVAGVSGVLVLPPSAQGQTFAKLDKDPPTATAQVGPKKLESAIKELEDLYAISIAYPAPLAELEAKIPAAINTKLSAEENLARILKGSQINYKKGAGNFYMLEKSNATSLAPSTTARVKPKIEAVERTIEGLVLDDTDTPIPGASVLIKGTMIGVVTDVDGKFTLTIPDENSEAVLAVSFIGFTTQEIPIGTTSNFTIKLASSDLALNEVVVTAFGLERDKKALGYATQSVDGKSLTEARPTNVANSLSGRVAGVQVTGNSMPGSGAQIVIRGSSSVAGNNQPLVVVDGVPLEQTSSRQYGNGLSEISPDNIKEMNILKGATAAALYGSRAANGVIMITTKNGSDTKGLGIEFNSNMTFDNPLVKPDFQNTYGGGAGYRTWYVDGRNGFDADGIRGTAGVDESWGAPMDGRMVPLWYSAPERVALLPQPNNWEEFWETGQSISNSVALSGGNEQGSFRVAIGRLDQTSIMADNDYFRNNFKLNTSYKFIPELQMSVNAEYIKSGSDNRGFTGSQDFIWAHRHTEYDKLKNWEDYYEIQRLTFRDGDDYPYANWQHEYFSNPFYNQKYLPNSNEKDRLVGSVALSYDLGENFNIMARTGTDYWTDTRININRAESTKNNVKRFGAYSENVYSSQETNSDIIITFDKDITPRLSLKVQGGAINRVNNYKSTSVSVGELTIDGLYNLGNYASPVTPSSTIREQVVNSVFGSAQFGFNNYLFLDVTGRNDWSSTLPTSDNSFFYPSAALSAVLTDIFDVQSGWLSFAKVRASLAQVGNDADPYLLNQVYSSEGLWAGTTPTYSESNEIANRNLKPEITTGKEVGVDLRFFEGRVGVDFTYYHQSTVNQILAVSISTASGYSSQILNAGEITNQGVELTINATPFNTASGFSWYTALNFSRNRNQVVELAEGLENYILGSQNSLTSEARVGQPYGSLYGRRYLRSPEGELIYNNGLPVLEEGTFIVGNIQPDWLGGWTNSFAYKGIELNTLIDVKMGGDIFDVGTGLARKTGQYIETEAGREEGVIGNGVMNIGTAEDPVYVPNDVIANATTFWNSQNPRTYHESGIFDGTYVKLRELSLGYVFPKNFLGNSFIQSMKLSFVGRNLAILYKNHPHMDPEVDMKGGNAQGFAYGQMPTTRSLGFNLNVTF
ncbi:SusC/RagA family TonB-linked outer membrane protein [Algoriphagus halophytocola]|uniref:SusC/RagA family TonB-linked outer membrane protein n=1 Tax=Algoriphagus halophytocola TaxID=2991499 RepID=A0ABY6MPJ8_9BACT|nr:MULTISPECIES: SusC/RagA family TonB-linked outer membrane protein [unclassified Algoriphagus]UZD24204.1 SusC/RagA family TonB-linked outer membrane protein [Algoriphagus sp. TR-M5]WBL41573.1 SusC/RagA family TonB-linked outer membrane protein [Algoriphagus sp. TR-M9]